MMPRKIIGKVHQREEKELVYSVREAVDNYLKAIKKLSEQTQREYREELYVFAAWCRENGILLHQVDNLVVDGFLEHLRETHKPSKRDSLELSSYTLAGYVRVIKAFLAWCVADETYGKQVRATTVSRIESPQIVERIIETFSAEQISALFDACAKEESEHLQMRDRAILALLLDSGIRANELCTLTIGHTHLDPKDAYVRIYGKGRKWGEVGLGEKSRREVARYIRQFREPTVEYEVELATPNLLPRQYKQAVQEALQQARLFVNRYGQPLTTSGLYRMVDRLGEWAGITGVRCSPHTFRHTFAKLFMLNGGDIYRLSKLLRHNSVATTEQYLKSLTMTEARKGAKSVLDTL